MQAAKAFSNKLIAENDKKLRNNVDHRTGRLLMAFSIIELTPAAAGFLMSLVVEHIFFQFDYLIAGFILTLLFSLILESGLPGFPIGLEERNK